MKRDNGNNEPGEVVTQFNATDHTQYFELGTTRLLDPGTKVRWSVVGLVTQAGKDIPITEITTDVIVGKPLTAHVSLPANLESDGTMRKTPSTLKDWPVGTYKVDIFLNDILVKTIVYIVAAGK